jgi:hypothetical protein
VRGDIHIFSVCLQPIFSEKRLISPRILAYAIVEGMAGEWAGPKPGKGGCTAMVIIKALLAMLAALASGAGVLFIGLGILARIFGDGSARGCLQVGFMLLLTATLFVTAAAMA